MAGIRNHRASHGINERNANVETHGGRSGVHGVRADCYVVGHFRGCLSLRHKIAVSGRAAVKNALRTMDSVFLCVICYFYLTVDV